MNLKKFWSRENTKILLTIISVAFGLLLGPILEKIIDPFYDTPTKALLTGFIFLAFITVVAGTAISIFGQNHNEQMKRFEAKLTDVEEQIRLTHSLEMIGITGADLNLPKELRSSFWDGAHDEMKILQTYIASLNQLSPSIFSAVKNGAKFKLLLLDPNGEMIHKRLSDLGLPNTIHAHIDAMERLKILIKKNNPNPELFEIRVYDRIPPFALYRSDKKVCMGLFWHCQHSPNGPHIFINDVSSPMGEAADNTFNEIWKTAKRLEIE